MPRLGHKPSSPNARIRICQINGRWQRQRQLLRVDRGAIYKCEAAPGNAKFPTARPKPLHQEEGHRADRFATQRPGLLRYVTASKPCGVARMNRRCRELTPGTIELQVKPCLDSRRPRKLFYTRPARYSESCFLWPAAMLPQGAKKWVMAASAPHRIDRAFLHDSEAQEICASVPGSHSRVSCSRCAGLRWSGPRRYPARRRSKGGSAGPRRGLPV